MFVYVIIEIYTYTYYQIGQIACYKWIFNAENINKKQLQ